MRKTKDNYGITLIALIITIIVLLILAGVSMSALVGDNGIISNAQLSSVMTKFSGYKEDMEMKIFGDSEVYASKDKLKEYIPTLEEKDKDKFVIIKSKLLYIGTNELESEAAKKLGLGGGSSNSSNSESAIKEIQSIIDGVIGLEDEDNSKVPENVESQNTDTKDGAIGIKLVDRETHLIDGKWNILIDYNKNNEETGRYESGYYWLKKGTTYKINEEDIEFKNDYVVNYEKKEYQILSERIVNWNQNNVLAVPEKDKEGNRILALNLDTMSFANGIWRNSENTQSVESKEVSTTEESFENFYVKENSSDDDYKVDTGIQKTGDVVYDETRKALKFNEDNNNTKGEGGYVKLAKTEEGGKIDFSNGFTFEMYCNLSRILTGGSLYENSKFMGLFCRMNNLAGKCDSSMRFGYGQDNVFAKFFGASQENINGSRMIVDNLGGVKFIGESPFKENEDFYMTIVYDAKNTSMTKEDYEKMEDKYDGYVDKLELYINGEKYGETDYYSYVYKCGLDVWNNNCPFFVGVCPWSGENNLYYLKGLVYTTRLYTKPMTEEQVKNSYDMTLKYRSSFLND